MPAAMKQRLAACMARTGCRTAFDRTSPDNKNEKQAASDASVIAFLHRPVPASPLGATARFRRLVARLSPQHELIYRG